jgi:cell fate (sporulation/competence/biofilm development) regulator YlbF (YheA/YmcA/DUF963 family)
MIEMEVVRKKAQELAEAIVNSPEYKRFMAAKGQVEAHQAALIMLRDFQKRQLELHKQQMEGTPVTEDQAEDLRKLYEIISVNPYVRELFEAEFVFSGLMMEVQEILSGALGLKEEEPGEEASEAPPTIVAPKKKIWTPGSDL